MSTLQDDVDLEPSPAVPGGGPASRWRADRVPSRVAWGWLVLLVLSALVLATVVVAAVRAGGISDGGITLAIISGLALVLTLAGTGVGVGAANDSRVDDDFRTYAVGVPVVLRRGPVPGDADAEAALDVDGRPVGVLRATWKNGDKRRALALGSTRRRLYRAGTDRKTPADVLLSLGRGGDVAGTATAVRRGNRLDWTVTVEHRTFRVRTRIGSEAPRVSLLDDRGRAWRADLRRRRVGVRLPEELTESGAAFVVLFLAELRQGLGGPGTPGVVSADPADGDDLWGWDDGPGDAGTDGAATGTWNDAGSPTDTGSSWSGDLGSSWSGGDTGSSWSGSDGGSSSWW